MFKFFSLIGEIICTFFDLNFHIFALFTHEFKYFCPTWQFTNLQTAISTRGKKQTYKQQRKNDELSSELTFINRVFLVSVLFLQATYWVQCRCKAVVCNASR